MTSLADDLLRSRTIPELRELVNSLEKDSGSKKTELQHMVGSKYHDFIQSADKIASMKEKSLVIEQQINQFWISNQQLLAKAQTILTYSQPQHKKLQKQQNSLPVEAITSASVWSKLNDCNVFDAAKLLLLAQSLSASQTFDSSKQTILLSYFDPMVSKALLKFSQNLSEDAQRQLSSTLFLSETVSDDANMLLLCDPEPETDSFTSNKGVKQGHITGMAGTSGLEIVHKAKAIAVLSLLSAQDATESSVSVTASVSAPQKLLQLYLAAAEVRVQDLLETQLTVGGNKSKGSKKLNIEDVDVEGEPAESKMGAGITAMVKLLQQTIMEVHALFLSPIDSASTGTTPSGTAPTAAHAPILGLVGHFQHQLLSETAQHLLQLVQPAAGTNSSTSGTPVNGGATASASFDLAKAFQEISGGVSVGGAGSSAIVREQRKVFKTWLERLFVRVTTQCKLVLASLTSAAEVAQLQQQVWSACVNIAGTAHSSSSSKRALVSHKENLPGVQNTAATELSGDALVASLHSYSQQAWEAASDALLSSVAGMAQFAGGAGGVGANAHTYLWCGVFRPCFLHQVERLLKHSCDEVLAHTKLQILRALRQQGVTLDLNTLKITSTSANSENVAKNANMLRTSDYSADVSHLSSPRIYQLAEKIRLQFEQDISRLLADVVDPVQSTESGFSSTADLEGLAANSNANLASTVPAGDGADPQSVGALARAMRTQCAQLVGHTLVLVRNLVEACQRALRDRAALPARGASGSHTEDLYECLRGEEVTCILTPDLQELIKRHSGSTLSGGAVSHSDHSSGALKSGEGRKLERADHSLLSSLLFLGRVAWLFKIRGSFLEYALQPKAATYILHGSNGMSGALGSASTDVGASGGSGSSGVLRSLRSGSASNNNSFRGHPPHQQSNSGGGTNNEDQFRSAFEIADTNGDGVLSYAEAVEALQAISGEADSSKSPSGSSATASAFNLSPSLTPTLTYTEFALICGSTLLSGDSALPVVRLQRCLEQIITATHVTWALCTVHMMGRNLRQQYLADLGFTNSSQSSGTATAKKTNKSDERDQKKPFKVTWVSKWIDLDGSIDEDGDASAGAQKEQVLIPGGMCASLRAFLHKVSQHGTSSLVSIDTMQSANATASGNSKRSYALAGSDNAPSARRHTAPVLRDEFSDLLDEVEEVSEPEDDEGGEANAFFESSGLLATLAGANHAGGERSDHKVVLSHLANRLLAQISLAYVHYVSVSVLNEARPLSGSTSNALSGAHGRLAVTNEALEEVALQSVFDLSVAQLLSAQWVMPEWHSTASSKGASARRLSGPVGFSWAVDAWATHLDPITAELVLPLVRVSTRAHVQSISLLAPHSNSTLVASTATELSPRANGHTSQGHGAKSSEQLLARVFPGATHSAARFVLLPLAISTIPVPVPSSGRNTPAAQSNATSAAHSRNASNGGVAAEAVSKASAPAAASTPTANTAARGMMNWFG